MQEINTPGPEPDHLKPEEDNWEEAVKKALNTPKPKEGWPKEPDQQAESEAPEPIETDEEDQDES